MPPPKTFYRMPNEPDISPKPGPGDGVAMAYVLMAGSAIFAAVPLFGFLTWFFAIPIMIYAVIIGVRELRKGDRTHGTMLVVIGAVAYPLWVFLAPALLVSALQMTRS